MRRTLLLLSTMALALLLAGGPALAATADESANADESISFIVNASPGTYELVVDIDPERAESRTRSTWIDWKDIPPTAKWKQEVFSAIENAKGVG
jgi:hypothetical protein